MVRTILTGKNYLKKQKQNRKSIDYEVSETNLNDEGEVTSDESEEVELEIGEGGGVESSEDGDSDDTLPVLKRSISNIGGVIKKRKVTNITNRMLYLVRCLQKRLIVINQNK